MSLSDAEVVAMLADMETLRVEAAHQRELLAGERERTRELTARLRSLDGYLVAAMERQRELHILLLHRDEELAALRAKTPALAAGAAPFPAPARAAPASPTLGAILINAWDRLMHSTQRPIR